MKILIQDLETLRFLGTDGRWVPSKDDARDFHSLLPAFYHGRDFTSRRFQVLLYSAEDNFCTSIIAGVGMAHKKIELPITKTIEPRTHIEIKTTSNRFNTAFLRVGNEDVRRHLN